MSSLVGFEAAGGVVTITLDRPERHNSLVPAMLEGLLSAFESATQMSGIGAMVLAANGQSFSTGGDVAEFYAHLEEIEAYSNRIVGLLNDVMLAMLRAPQPIVAAVHGIVTGGSLGLVLASDVVLVAPQASFTPWYTEVGFSPDGGWTAVLPDVIGRGRATTVLLENRTITADEAVGWGLAGRMVDAGSVAAEARRAATAIAEMRSGAVASARRLARGDLDRIAAALEAERRAFVSQIATEEARLGMERFLGIDPRR